jgi:hypothetical protein
MDKQDIHAIIKEAETLKQGALNFCDARFAPWRDRALQCIQQLASVKQPAFEEIRFASDFLLSKPADEQAGINDRIALACDIDLAVEILRQVITLVEEKEQQEKGKRQAQPTPTLTGRDTSLLELLDSFEFSEREKEEVRMEFERVEAALEQPQPDWDRAKRTIKFLLDFDRNLALQAIPQILSRFSNS